MIKLFRTKLFCIYFPQHRKRSFTLIELLVTIAIVGLLSALVIIAVSSMVIKGRDARRAGDTRSMQSAVELYYSFNDTYPIWVGGGCTSDPNNPLTVALVPTYMSILPQDPLSSQYCYHYISNSDGSLYKFSAYMEKNTTLAQNDGGIDSTYYELFNLSGNTQMKPYLDNLVGFWQMNESSGSRAKDVSGNNNHGTLSNTPPTWQSSSNCMGSAGSCLSFSGSNNYVDWPNDLGYRSQFSVFSWFIRKGTPGSGYHIIFGGQELEISIPEATGEIRSGLYTNGRYVSNHGSGLVDGQWHFIGFTFDGSVKKSYIDGAYVGQLPISGTLTYSFNYRRSGIFGSSSSYYLNGLIDDLRIYSCAFSDCQVCESCRNYWTQAQCGNCTNCAGS